MRSASNPDSKKSSPIKNQKQPISTLSKVAYFTKIDKSLYKKPKIKRFETSVLNESKERVKKSSIVKKKFANKTSSKYRLNSSRNLEFEVPMSPGKQSFMPGSRGDLPENVSMNAINDYTYTQKMLTTCQPGIKKTITPLNSTILKSIGPAKLSYTSINKIQKSMKGKYKDFLTKTTLNSQSRRS